MSFLLPLFLIGAGAIAAPILFHLIRREARGEQAFSSLMFLEASPPTMMRRSRIDHWWLLLLRSLAVLLLVAAFARPSRKSNESVVSVSQSKRIAVLVDRSASMAREGVWSTAIAKARKVVETAPASHCVSLYAFDDHVQPIVSIATSEVAVPSERNALLLAGLETLALTQKASDLGQAFAVVSDELSEDEKQGDREASVISEIILISDFQSGSRIDRLENHQWPSTCRLILERVDSVEQENVSANFLEDHETGTVPIRLVHRGESEQTKVEVQWIQPPDSVEAPDSNKPAREAAATNGDATETSPERLTLELPSNGGVVAKLAKPIGKSSILELRGDQVAFDNRRWFTKPKQRSFQLACVDDKTRETAQSLGYFLERIPFSTDELQVDFVWHDPSSKPNLPEVDTAPFVVSQCRLNVAWAEQLRKRVEEGGHCLWVLDCELDTTDSIKAVQDSWEVLFGVPGPEIVEASSEQEALFGKIEFSASPFRSLSDSRFNDFTKIRFWKHRRVELAEQAGWQIVARLDDDAPLLAGRRLGNGKFWLMSSGWQPSESRLALSSKFVPIIAAVFNEAIPPQRSFAGLEVGDRIEVEEGDVWFSPNNRPLSLESSAEKLKPSFVVEETGLYRVELQGNEQPVAVNIPLSESDTRVMAIEQLERLGVVTGEIDDEAKSMLRSIVRKNRELEKEQSLWRWFMLSVLGLLAVETIWSRRQ